MNIFKYKAYCHISKTVIQEFCRATPAGLEIYHKAPGGVSLMLYIGLKDCEGKELSDKDIVEDTLTGKRYQIFWDQPDASFKMKSLEDPTPNNNLRFQDKSRLKFITNLYELETNTNS